MKVAMLVNCREDHKMKITKSQLKQIIKEEIEEMLLEDESDYLSNIYKWCPAGTKCSPERQKTKWWKGK
jgi:hypothetical protein